MDRLARKVQLGGLLKGGGKSPGACVQKKGERAEDLKTSAQHSGESIGPAGL